MRIAMARARLAGMGLVLAVAVASEGRAVTLNGEGMGQALIYPYYTVNRAGGNFFNTYFQVKNHAADAKALRVRFREGRRGQPVFELNLYLSANDTWTAAIVPQNHSDGTAAFLFTIDSSCTDPELPYLGTPFLTAAFSGTRDDGAGEEAERTREGFVEVLEMGTLIGASALAVTPTSATSWSFPPDCGALRTGAPSVAAPTGGLSGSLLLINPTMGFTLPVQVVALADLAGAPYFRPPSDPYPAFTASEIVPVSVVRHGNHVYRSVWSRPEDAVSAVLMRKEWRGEFLVDRISDSRTDIVVALPTRHLHLANPTGTAPFAAGGGWAPNCIASAGRVGHGISGEWWNREQFGGGLVDPSGCDLAICPKPLQAICASAAVAPVIEEASDRPRSASMLGSKTLGLHDGAISMGAGQLNGWIKFQSTDPSGMTSLPSSVRIDVNTGSVTTGSHRLEGLPVVGFTTHLYQNGTLKCSTGDCLGTYGAAFPLRYRRAIGLAP